MEIIRARSITPRTVAAAVVLLMSCLPAFASLGGNVASIDADRAHMRASLEVAHSGTCDIHRIQSPIGTVVKEFVSSAGRVFAVTWHGPFVPDLQQILGPSYFQQYSEALQAREHHYGHRSLNLQLPGLVVQTGGHMRDYFGRAYIPDMVPQGVRANEIQ